MDSAQINEFRVAHGLKPLEAPARDMAQKHRQDANKAARAQANRELKAKRSKGGK